MLNRNIIGRVLALQTAIFLFAGFMLQRLGLFVATAFGSIGLPVLDDAIEIGGLIVIRFHAIFTNKDNNYYREGGAGGKRFLIIK